MRSQPTIFDSRAERELFQAIAGTWEPTYRLYPHIPFANVVELDPRHLDATEMSFLNKTSVDYVVTDSAYAPLLGIEFDGLGHGRSAHGRYFPTRAVKKDPRREWKLALKCRVAEAASVPFVVVSYDEAAPIDDTGLTIAHGIVGAFIAGRQLDQRLHTPIAFDGDPTPQEIERTLVDIEFLAAWDNNPIVRRAGELSFQLYERHPGARVTVAPRHEPERPPAADPWGGALDASALLDWWKTIRRFGVDVTISAGNRQVQATTWIRNYEATGLSPHGWLLRLGELVALQKFFAGVSAT